MSFSGLAINHCLASLARFSMAGAVGAHFIRLLFQPGLTSCRSSGLPSKCFAISSGAEPVSQGRSLVSCSSGMPMIVNFFSWIAGSNPKSACVYGTLQRGGNHEVDLFHGWEVLLQLPALFFAEWCEKGIMHGMVGYREVVEALSMANTVDGRSHGGTRCGFNPSLLWRSVVMSF